jgi:major membrane immunogen (membrane-anchored lipoprotein)
MAGYNSGVRYNGGNKQSAHTAKPVAAASGSGESSQLFKTGLWAPTREGSKAIATVQVKETITIPAGSYLNLYQADKKNEKSPDFNLQVRSGKLKEV